MGFYDSEAGKKSRCRGIQVEAAYSMEIEGGWNRGVMSGDREEGKGCSFKPRAVLIEGRFHCEADMCNIWPDMCIN